MTTLRLLTLKIGNSNLGFGIFDGDTLVHSWRAETRRENTADEYGALLLAFLRERNIEPGSIRAAAVVSVVPALNETMREVCVKYLRVEPFFANAGIKSGIQIKYEDPRALGGDRLASLAAAKKRYGAPLILIDMGTATTFNVLNARGDFIGGAIAPGINMTAEALHQFTAKLPGVDISPPDAALATNTRDALRSGIFFGYVGLIEGMVARLKTELNDPTLRVIATGGMAQQLATYCPSVDVVNMDLALDGLRLLFEMNQA